MDDGRARGRFQMTRVLIIGANGRRGPPCLHRRSRGEAASNAFLFLVCIGDSRLSASQNGNQSR